MLALAGKGALVVGARRLGQQVVRRLAAEGIGLAIGYRSSRAEAEGLYYSLVAKGAKACLVQGDLAVEEDVKRMVQEAREGLGDLSFVVNLASDFPRTPLASLDSEAWDHGMAAAKGSFLLAVHAAHALMKNPGPTRGHMLLFSDWAARETPYRNYLPYLTSKAAIDFMTRAFAVELAPHGILVNAIAPGPTMRPEALSEETWQRRVVAGTPLQRESSIDEITELIVVLLKSETITGETIRVDSGRHLAGPGAMDVEERR